MNKISYNLENIEFIFYYDEFYNKRLKVINNCGFDRDIEIKCYLPVDLLPILTLKTKINHGNFFIFKNNINGIQNTEIYVDKKNKGFYKILSDRKKYNLNDKVICLGLNKTGTTTLAKAMGDLGYQTLNSSYYYYLRRSTTYSNTYNIENLIENTDINFFDDCPFSYPVLSLKILKKYPQCKYILTKRSDKELWVNSFINHFSKWTKTDIEKIFNGESLEKNVFNYNENFLFYGEIMSMVECYNIDKLDGDFKMKLSKIYEEYNNDITIFFKLNNIDWIEIDVSKEGELKKLSNWLNVNTDKNNFEHHNKGNYGN